jgi:hypothetical protein
MQVLEMIFSEVNTRNFHVRVIRKGREVDIELKTGSLTKEEELIVREWWYDNMQESDLANVNKRVRDRLGLKTRAATQAENQSTTQQLPDHSRQPVEQSITQAPTTEIPGLPIVRESPLGQDVPTPISRRIVPSIEHPQLGQAANSYRDGFSVDTELEGSGCSSAVDEEAFDPSSSAATMPRASSQTSLNAEVTRIGLRDRKVRADPEEWLSGGRGNVQESQDVTGSVPRRRARQKGKAKAPSQSQ